MPLLSTNRSTDGAGRLGLVLGADSLRGRRSGIGRMTLEILQAIGGRPEIGGTRLLLKGRLHRPEAVLAEMAGQDTPVMPSRAESLVNDAKRLVASIPGVQGLRAAHYRRLQRPIVAALRHEGGARIVYHEPNMIPQPFDGPTVVTVNDLSWHHHPEYHPADRLAWIARNLRRTLDSATRFVAISQFTADAMVQEFNVAADRIDVAALAAGPQFQPTAGHDAAAALARHGLDDQRYVLSVSTLEPRKNFDRLMAAHALLPEALRRQVPLVIAGGSGWGDRLAGAQAERARQDGSLRLLGHVSDADLIALYGRAAVFAYVSLYEGFGLPVIEAMACGSPVLASATTATGETAGDAAELVDPLDVDAIAAGLRRVLEDGGHADGLRARGLAHAARFTWDRTATALIQSWNRAAP